MQSQIESAGAKAVAPQEVTNPARLIYQPVIGFIEQIAARSAAPGGGSAAALSGSVGAGLLTMVIQFTIGKSEYEGVAQDLMVHRATIEKCRSDLMAKIDEDTDAYNSLRVANKLPARDQMEQSHKAGEIRSATLRAIHVPLATMKLCLSVLQIAPEIARDGNVNTVSDAGTGTELLLAGLEGAAYNVLINLSGLEMQEHESYLAEVALARQRGRDFLDETRRIVSAKIAI